MLSFGMLTSRALSIAYRSLRLASGSPPPWRAAMMIARLSLLNSLPRLASIAPFLCLIVAQCECPDILILLRKRVAGTHGSCDQIRTDSLPASRVAVSVSILCSDRHVCGV